MLFLKSKDDLYRMLQTPALFSKDPVSLQIPELDSNDILTHEKRINLLKKESSWPAAIKGIMISLAVLTGIYIHLPGFSLAGLAKAIPIMLVLSLTCGISGKLIARESVKIRLRKEIEKILKQLSMHKQV